MAKCGTLGTIKVAGGQKCLGCDKTYKTAAEMFLHECKPRQEEAASQDWRYNSSPVGV